jgi:hypothetical protein
MQAPSANAVTHLEDVPHVAVRVSKLGLQPHRLLVVRQGPLQVPPLHADPRQVAPRDCKRGLDLEGFQVAVVGVVGQALGLQEVAQVAVRIGLGKKRLAVEANCISHQTARFWKPSEFTACFRLGLQHFPGSGSKRGGTGPGLKGVA